MIAGLASNAGPTLNVPVPDSKDRNSESSGTKFSDVLDKNNVAKTEKPEKIGLKPENQDKGEKVSLDDKEVKSESPPDPKVMDPRTSALREQRNRAIRKFMDSFESEFGVPPTEMVEAMSQLTAQELEKPPETTVDNLIAQLNLAPQDELKAKKMYLGFLMQLKQMDIRSDLPRPQDDLLSQLSAQRIQLSGEKKGVIKNEMQTMSDKFWMKGEHAQPQLQPQLQTAAQMPLTPEQAQAHETLKKMITAESLGIDPKLLQEDPKVAASMENLMKQIEALPQQEVDPQPGAEKIQTDALPKEIAFLPVANTAPQAPAMNQDSQMQQQQGQDDQSFLAQEGIVLQNPVMQQETAVTSEFKKQMIKTSENPQVKKITKEEVQTILAGGLSNMKPGQLESLIASLPQQDRPVVDVTPAQKTENVQQIINQAQVLLKKGGGEMKVEMTPEGMGSIQMKVQVADGKVQLHMSTETPEAKKMIESSMSDLKHSLAAHQLSMDLVKVDVVTQTHSSQNAQNDNNQSQMQNFLNQQQRDGTKQFWQQFNENFGNRQARENYFDAQNIRGPTRHQSLPGFDTPTASGRARTDGRGKSLNLVA